MAGMLTVACKNEKKDDIQLEGNTTVEGEISEVSNADGMNDAAMKEKMDEETEAARANSIAGLAQVNADLSSLTMVLQSAQLDTMLMKPGSYTVFAPSNHAFEKLPEKTRQELMLPENKAELTSVLQYHVAPGRITSDKLDMAIKNGGGEYTFKTVNGDELTAMKNGDQIVIKDGRGKKAQVIKGNVEASNGIVYIIDDVLMAKK